MHARIVETLVDVCKNRAVSCLPCNVNILDSILETVLFNWLIKVTPQKRKLPNILFLTFPGAESKNTKKKKKDTPLFSLKRFDGPNLPPFMPNHARFLISLRYILR